MRCCSPRRPTAARSPPCCCACAGSGRSSPPCCGWKVSTAPLPTAARWVPPAFARACFGGLAPTPWRSGGIKREQGIAAAGNPRVRKTLVELAWTWLQWQPDSALSRWFQQRVKGANARGKRVLIVALARKLLVALWRYVTDGVVPEGAVLKAA